MSAEVTAIVLAGGLARRMGGLDKGLQTLRGRPMIAWVLERLVPQASEIIINANQNLEQYGAFGYPVVSDEIGGFAGPLAGLHAGLKNARHDLIMIVPCDSPFLPADLVARLFAALEAQAADLAVAKTGEQPHPVFSLCRRALLPHLANFLREGGRKVDLWYASLKVVEVPFDDEAEAFSNINTAEELRSFETFP
ncbi:MAG: molybdenum cofactor guanylyltransferase [Betaproteobacteria bacterium]|nr:molybdenum cofactor guanylyltransferase [Betaproteobacteria bacterium]